MTDWDKLRKELLSDPDTRAAYEARKPSFDVEAGKQLVCAECGATSTGTAEGWRAYLDDDDQAVTFCPDCAEREFG